MIRPISFLVLSLKSFVNAMMFTHADQELDQPVVQELPFLLESEA